MIRAVALELDYVAQARREDGVVTVSGPVRLASMGEYNTSGERKTPKPARFSAAVLPVVGLVAVLVGCLVAWSNAKASIA
ncbi:hypothetical protein DQ354_16250 [Arthrobacter sp. AQ5-06]|nr:hypothetical protein DQ354_16250 [Arthrobacter sp. AQ5-06]